LPGTPKLLEAVNSNNNNNSSWIQVFGVKSSSDQDLKDTRDWERSFRENFDEMQLNKNSTFDLVSNLNLINLILIGISDLNNSNMELFNKDPDSYYNFDFN
jgi:hypothetical protein